MSEETVAQNTHTMVQRLEDLRIEHMSLISSLESPKTEKSDIILKNIKSIDVGLDEAQLMMEFTLHLQNVEIEKRNLIAQIKQLSEENENLRDRLAVAEEKLQNFERMVCNVDDDKSNLDVSVGDKNLLSFAVCLAQSNGLVDDELTDCDSDTTISPRAINPTVYVECEESEALCRFKRFQNLAIRYASESKYEVAFSLCKQAVDELTKTTVGRYHPYIARMMAIVSLLYGIQSKYNKATKLLHEAIREKLQPFTFKSESSSK